MRYLKLWEQILDSEKVQGIDDRTFRAWVYMLVCAKKHDRNGLLPPANTLVFWTRQSEKKVADWLERLKAARLVDETQDGLVIHDWDYWQAPFDPTAKDRMKRHREKETANNDRNVTPDVTRNGTRDVPVSARPRTRNYGETVKGESEKGNNPPTPRGGEVVSLSVETEPPEYPDEATSMFMIMPGQYKLSEADAREIWGHIWRTWKDSRLCHTFYEHQQWCSKVGWLHAIKTAIEQNVKPQAIKYLEVIAMAADVNGIKKKAPAKKADIGPAPYVPRVVHAPLPPSVGVPAGPQFAPGEVAKLLGLRGES